MSVPDLSIFEKDSDLPEDVLDILKGMKSGLRGRGAIPVVKIHDKKRRLTAYISYSTDIKRLNELDVGKELMNCCLLKLTSQNIKKGG